MNQYKFYIRLSFNLLVGVVVQPKDYVEIFILCFKFGFGLTESAKGFNFRVE